MTPDPVKLAVAQAILGRLPEEGRGPRDIALTGPTLLAQVITRNPLSAVLRIQDEHGIPRYFEVKITEKM